MDVVETGVWRHQSKQRNKFSLLTAGPPPLKRLYESPFLCQYVALDLERLRQILYGQKQKRLFFKFFGPESFIF
jgi:hypothetical protein